MWKSRSRQLLLDRAPWLKVWIEQIELPNGVIIDDYYRWQTRSWVVVFAVTVDGRVPLVRQYRYGLDETTLELPAGYIEDGEAPELSAQRELREEVGCAAPSFEYLGGYAMMAPRGDMKMHLVVARDAQLVGAQNLEVTEDIEVVWMTLPELREAWRTGAINQATHAQAVARGLEAVGGL
ncbi:NUDIX hydrolase [Chloroflexota bacterium]